MPVHDWTRVSDGEFHALHTLWLSRLTEALNGLLPDGYYALPELKVQRYSPDITALTAPPPPSAGPAGVAVAEPRADRRVALRVGGWPPARRLVVRAVRGRRVVAVFELMSPGDKHRAAVVDDFAEKVAGFVRQGVHAAVVDILPPGPHDPAGEPPPPDRPLTVAGYRADDPPVAYLSYAAVGALLPTIPLFLDDGAFVDLPLEETHMATYARLPAVVRADLEGAAP